MKQNKKSKKFKKAEPVIEDVGLEKFIDGKDIKHILVDLEMVQSEFAKEMGIAAATLSRIIRGRCVMSRPYYKLLIYTVKDLEQRLGKKVTHEFKPA
jgi:predicted transcriptional regulator